MVGTSIGLPGETEKFRALGHLSFIPQLLVKALNKRTDSVGEVAAVNFQRQGRACHQRHVFDLSDFQMFYARLLFGAVLT
jgi:hypothetical protein